MSWSMHSCAVLFSSIRVVDILRGSMGLLGYHCSIGSMGLVNRVAHSWSVSVLDHLMVGLVGQGVGKKGGDSNESLQIIQNCVMITFDLS